MEEIKRRILSIEVMLSFNENEETPEQIVFQVLDTINRTRRRYLQSVAKKNEI